MTHEFLDRTKAVIQGFKDDPKGFLLRGVDSGQRVPVTKTKTAYGLTIHARVGNRRGVIGAVHEISAQQALQVDDEFEVDANARGLPRELIPQIVGSRTLTLRRYDLYTATLEQVFGTPELITLADQIGPVSLRFMWKSPQPSDVGAIVANSNTLAIYEYLDCYITNLGQTVSMQNVIVGREATLIWRNVRRIQ